MPRARAVRSNALPRSRDDRGAVALEFALMLPILVMLLLGVTTMGVSYSDHLALTNAVREGARLGSSLDSTASTTAWADAVQARAIQTFFNTGTLTTAQVCVQLVQSDGTVIGVPTTQGSSCGTAPTSPTVATGACVVKVWAKRPENVTLGVLPNIGFSIGAQSASSYGRTTTKCTAS